MRMLKQLGLASAALVLILGLSLASDILLSRALYGDAACVDARGSWQNWAWANVPVLSPRCGEASHGKS